MCTRLTLLLGSRQVLNTHDNSRGSQRGSDLPCACTYIKNRILSLAFRLSQLGNLLYLGCSYLLVACCSLATNKPK
jgi:hypothetical protein